MPNSRPVPFRLIAHLLLVERLLSDESRPPARSRLEAAIGPALTEKLLLALARPQSSLPADSEAVVSRAV